MANVIKSGLLFIIELMRQTTTTKKFDINSEDLANIITELQKFSNAELSFKNLDEVLEFLVELEDSQTLPQIVCTVSELKTLIETNTKVIPILGKIIKKKSSENYSPNSSLYSQTSEINRQISTRSSSLRSNLSSTSSIAMSRVKKNIEKVEFNCDLCGKKYYSIAKLNWHKKTHNKAKTRKYLCNHCDFQTDRTYNLDQHKNFMHHKDKTLGKTLFKKL